MTARITTARTGLHRQKPLLSCASLSILAFTCLLITPPAWAKEQAVFDSSSLHKALREAIPGDNIVLYPGRYLRSKTQSTNGRSHYYHSHRSGTRQAPITLRSYSRDDLQVIEGSTIIDSGYTLYLTGDHWVVKDLIFQTGMKGIMLDSANHNVLDNISVSNTRDEGVHFRQSSSNNVLSNCHIYDTGRLKPGIGEAVYVGSHKGNEIGDHSNNNRIGGCQFGPGVTAEAVDIKSGTVGTIVEHNTIDAHDLSGVNFADSFIDIKGDDVIIRHNQMDWKNNSFIDHGIHILKRDHKSSNIYNNTVTLGDDMAFLKIGQGTVRSKDNQLNFNGHLASFYGAGAVNTSLSQNMPATHQYTGFQNNNNDIPKPDSDDCLTISKRKKTEVNLNTHNCITIPIELSGNLLQVWDSNEYTDCNFRGELVSMKSQTRWQINSNYAGTRQLMGNRFRISPSNNCNYLLVRWL